MIWLLGFGSVVLLGVNGGGYDPLVHDQVGIAVWWIVLGSVVVGALPRTRPSIPALVAVGLLSAFLAWTALSLIWTESSEKTFAEIARVSGYLGFFMLAILAGRREGERHMVAGIATGVAVVAFTALLSRLHPAWFDASSQQTGAFLPGSRERLSYPINYWNGLAGLIAIGLPLMLQMATDARRSLVRCLAAAALPPVMLTLYFTLSRGGIGAAIVAVGVFFAFSSNRLPKLLTAGIPVAMGAILIAVAASSSSLLHGLRTATAHHQGNELLLLTAGAAAGSGLAVLALSVAAGKIHRPDWTVPSRRLSAGVLAAVATTTVFLAVAVNGPSRLSDAWTEFKESNSPIGGAGRLSSVGGESRYAIWSSAVREMQSSPVHGTGAGTFEYWWSRDATVPEPVIDAHSLYLQVLGELGIVGVVILIAFLGAVLVPAIPFALRAPPERRSVLAAALGGFVAFCVAATVDWIWQIPALAVAMLLLAGTLISGPGRDTSARPGLSPIPRTAVSVASALLIILIAIPLASAGLIRESQNDARDGAVMNALSAARSAQAVEPFAASPRLQEALVLEQLGRIGPAAMAATAATEREPTNWRTWLVLSRVEAERGHAVRAVTAYRKARSLNPRSKLFKKAGI